MDINIITPIIAAIIGSTIGVIAGYGFQSLNANKEKDALRTLLKIEIKNNKNNLYKFHNKILNDSWSHEAEDLASELAERDLIEINNTLWLDKTTLFVHALNEGEINNIENFYQLLKDCIDIQLSAINLKKEEKEIQKKSNVFWGDAKNWPFSIKSEDMWNQYRDTYLSALNKGSYLISKLEH